MTASVTLRSAADAAAAVPHILGFVPASSIVVLAVGGGQTARIDFPTTPAEVAEAVDVLEPAYAQNPTPGVLLLAYTDDTEAARTVLDAVAERLVMHTRIFDRLLVDGDTCTSFSTGRDETVAPDSQHAMSLRFREAGARAPRGSRAEFGEHLTSGTKLTGEVLIDAMTPITDAEAGPIAAWLRERVEHFRIDRQPLDDADAARALTAVRSSEIVRDVAIDALTRGDKAQVDLWTDLVRRAPAPLHTEAGVILALACWLDGDGASAWLALDHAAAPDGHLLAALMSSLLENAVNPDLWEKHRRATIA